MTHPTQQLFGTEVHTMQSDAVGDAFEITVAPPPPGTEGPVGVVYLTDATTRIGTAVEAVGLLSTSGEIPPLLLVGVGYPIGGDWPRWTRLRTRDFTPVTAPDPEQYAAIAPVIGPEPAESAGAPRFLDFLTDELQPWVRDRYDVSDDSVYIGNSLGGLFGVYTLFHRPAAFRRYVIGRPWLCWDAETTTAYEPGYAADHRDLGATVFLGAGADEDVLPPAMSAALQPSYRTADVAGRTRRLAEALAQRQYPNLTVSWRIFPEETHFTMPGILVAHGLRAVYADWRRL